MRLKVTVDSSQLKRDLKKFTEALNKDAADSIIELAQTGCTQLAYRVEPYGITGKAKDISEKAIYKDINKVYWTNGRTYNAVKRINPRLAAAYSKAVNENDDQKAEKIVDSVINDFSIKPMDSGQHLKASRNSRGRVSKPSPVNVDSVSDLERLKALKVLTGGTAKAGFLQAGESLGSKTRIQKWLKKAAGLGSSRIIRNGWETVVWIYNHVKYTSSVISETKIQQAVRNGYVNHLKKMQKQADKIASKV
jgi:hypothetical protein